MAFPQHDLLFFLGGGGGTIFSNLPLSNFEIVPPQQTEPNIIILIVIDLYVSHFLTIIFSGQDGRESRQLLEVRFALPSARQAAFRTVTGGAQPHAVKPENIKWKGKGWRRTITSSSSYTDKRDMLIIC